jgi:hypothetical protein
MASSPAKSPPASPRTTLLRDDTMSQVRFEFRWTRSACCRASITRGLHAAQSGPRGRRRVRPGYLPPRKLTPPKKIISETAYAAASFVMRQGGKSSLELERRTGMDPQLQSPRNISNELHPVIYKGVAALLTWFIAAAWTLFGGQGYIDFAFAIISVLLFIIIAILAALWRTSQRSRNAHGDSTVPDEGHGAAETEPFFVWLQGKFSTWTDQEKSSTAALEILLPFAAVAFGLTALGIVFNLVRGPAASQVAP